MKRSTVLVAALLGFASVALSHSARAAEPAATPCGGEIDCEIADGAYSIALPEGWDAAEGGPAVMHLHGYGGSGGGVLRNSAFVLGFLQRGYAVIAPTGQRWQRADGKLSPNDWSVRDGVSYPRDDVAFLKSVLEDAAGRHGVDPARLLMSGFSRGGSMVWEMACLAPEFALGYAPSAGGFWLPEVTDCAGPVNLYHSHGFADRIVPLEGRQIPIAEKITQGDIWRGLTLWRRENGCRTNAENHATRETSGGAVWIKGWSCQTGSLTLALHGGGHSLPTGWTEITLDWFENLAGPPG